MWAEIALPLNWHVSLRQSKICESNDVCAVYVRGGARLQPLLRYDEAEIRARLMHHRGESMDNSLWNRVLPVLALDDVLNPVDADLIDSIESTSTVPLGVSSFFSTTAVRPISLNSRQTPACGSFQSAG